MKHTAISFLDTPIGKLKIIGDELAIKLVAFTDEEERSTDGKVPVVVRNCKFQLKEYFEGKRKEFDVPLDPDGTEFQKEVWQELLQIPFGRTSTYKVRRFEKEQSCRNSQWQKPNCYHYSLP